MKNLMTPFCAFIIIISPSKSVALFGADAAITAPYLIEILAQSIKQYKQMKVIYENAKHHKDLIQNINMGINEAIGLMEMIPIKDENVLGHLQSFRIAISEIESLYGKVPKGKEELLLRLHDETVAESIRVSNSLKAYSELQELNSKRIARNAHQMSPLGAARSNLEAHAAILHTLNQILKVNGQMLKLQSESLAMSNKKAKESNYHFEKVNRDLDRSFKGFKATFNTPRF